MNAASSNRRSLWPRAIIGYFTIVLCAMAVFVTWAVRQNMDLVRPDYYEHEILFQKQIDAVNRARPFASQITVAYEIERQTLSVRVPSAHVAGRFSGTAHLYRPSDASLDQRVELKPSPDGAQIINARELAPGLWKVRLDWTANGETFAFERSIVIGG